MNNDKLLELMKSIDPESVRVPIGIRKIVDAVIAIEREECAKACDERHHNWRFGDGDDSTSGPKECAEAIRNRSKGELK